MSHLVDETSKEKIVTQIGAECYPFYSNVVELLLKLSCLHFYNIFRFFLSFSIISMRQGKLLACQWKKGYCHCFYLHATRSLLS